MHSAILELQVLNPCALLPTNQVLTNQYLAGFYQKQTMKSESLKHFFQGITKNDEVRARMIFEVTFR